MKPWFLIGFICCLLLTACQQTVTSLPKASSKENYIKPDNPDPIVGDYVTARPFSIVLTDVQQKKQLTLNAMSHKAKTAFLCVSIGITNNSSEAVHITPDMFRLVDSNGKKIKPNVTLDLLLNNNGKGFFHRPIKPMDRQNIMLVFDTAVGVGQGYLEITSGPNALKQAHIRLLK